MTILFVVISLVAGIALGQRFKILIPTIPNHRLNGTVTRGTSRT